MIRSVAKPLTVACIGLLGIGCQKVNSSSVKTSGMYADFSATAKGDGNTYVRAALRVGGALSNTFVDLQPSDTLSATTGATTLPLGRTPEPLGAVSYTNTFTGDTALMPFSIAFTRTSDTSAPNSSTTLPAKFSFLAPTANAVVMRSQPFDIKWDAAVGPTGDTVDVSLTGTCIQPLYKLGQTDNGQITIMAGELKAGQGQDTMTCGVQISVSRKHAGTVDPAIGEGGAFFGIQQRTLNISSAP